MEKADCNIQTSPSMKANGSKEKHMDSAYIKISMEPTIKDIGMKICNMDMASKGGVMGACSKGCLSSDRKVERANTHGRMGVRLRETGFTT